MTTRLLVPLIDVETGDTSQFDAVTGAQFIASTSSPLAGSWSVKDNTGGGVGIGDTTSTTTTAVAAGRLQKRECRFMWRPAITPIATELLTPINGGQHGVVFKTDGKVYTRLLAVDSTPTWTPTLNTTYHCIMEVGASGEGGIRYIKFYADTSATNAPTLRITQTHTGSGLGWQATNESFGNVNAKGSWQARWDNIASYAIPNHE